MDKNKGRPKRKVSDDYERGALKRARQINTNPINRSSGSFTSRGVNKASYGQKSTNTSNDDTDNNPPSSSDVTTSDSTTNRFVRLKPTGNRSGDRLESKNSLFEKETGSVRSAASGEHEGSDSADSVRVDISKLDSKILELVGGNSVDLFKLVYYISVGSVDPVKCVDVIRFYLSSSGENSTDVKEFRKSTSDEDAAKSDITECEESRNSPTGILVFKLLDLVSFFLDVSKKKSNLLYFLQALESLGVNKEIISVIDANKLDSCNYSEGLVKILIRERTRNNYVLKVHNLYRESPRGFLALISYFSSINGRKLSTGEEGSGTDFRTVADTIKRITGLYKLCPLRVLYEVLNWLVLEYFSPEFVLGLLSMYNVEQIRFCILFYLQVNGGTVDTTNLTNGNVEDAQDSAGKENMDENSENDPNKQSEHDSGYKDSDVESSVSTTCSGIYYIIALFVTNKYMKLEDIYKYLSPSDSYIKQLSNHFMHTVRSGTGMSNLESGSGGSASRADNLVLVELMKLASFYTISNEYLNSCVPLDSKKLMRVNHLLELFGDPKYSGFFNNFTNDPGVMSAQKDESQVGNFLVTGSFGANVSDSSSLLNVTNYQLLKSCVYSYNFPKVFLLSNLLGCCDDFRGDNWNLCYSLIVHLYKQDYCVFFNTSLVQRFHSILDKVLSGSSCPGLTKTSYDSDSLDLSVEWVILNKLEYYFMYVGSRANEDIVLFNRVLSYLYHLLQHLDFTLKGVLKSSGKTQKNSTQDGVSTAKRLKLKITKIIYKYVIFNIMNCCEGNFQVSDKIWNILKLFTTLERYQIYSKINQLLNRHQMGGKGDSMMDTGDGIDNDNTGVYEAMKSTYYVNQMHFVRRTHQVYNHKLKNIFKKITCELLKSVKSPTIRSIVSIITAISAINPFSVVTLIIKQSEMFNNLLLPLCELTKYFQSYTIDVFIYQLTVNLLWLIGARSGSKDVTVGSGGRSGSGKLVLSDARLDCNNLIKEDDNNKISVNSVILCKIFKRHNECDIAPLMTVLALLLNYSISNKLEIKHSGSSGFLLGVNAHSDSSAKEVAGSSPKRRKQASSMVKQVDILLDSGNYYDVVFTIFKVLDYLINLFEIMNGIIIIDMNKMTNDQLMSQCGSFSLKTESQLMNLDEEVNLNNKKVLKIVSRPFFLHSLLLILGRLLNELVYDSYFTNYKLLVEIANKFHSVIMLLVEFLSTSTNETFGNSLDDKDAFDDVASERLVKTDIGAGKEFLDRLSKYYSGNYIDFFRQYLLVGVSITGHHNAKISGGGKEEKVLNDKFVEYINTLNIYDIYVPVEQYDNCINKLVSHYNHISPNTGNLGEAAGSKGNTPVDVNNSTNLSDPVSPINPTTRSVNSAGTRSTNGNLIRRMKRIKNRIAALTDDKQSHQSRNDAVLEKLKLISKNFVKNEQKVGPQVTIAFIARIIYPRVFISELNSIFCCKLVDLMMLFRVNYFNYFDFVNCYCKLLVPLINYCTESEVINFSLFFNYSFNLIKNWVNSKETFEKLVVDNPCFCLTFRFNPEKQFKYQQLLQVLKKWEYLILLSLFSCYTGGTAEKTNRSVGATSGDAAGADYNSDRGDSDAANAGNEGDNSPNDDKDENSNEDSGGDNSSDTSAANNSNSVGDDDNDGNDHDTNEKKTESSYPANSNPDGNTTPTYNAGSDAATHSPNTAAIRGLDGANTDEPVERVNSWIEIKNVVIFLNKVSANFPVSYNSSVKVVNFLKSILKVSKKENWQDVTVCTNTLIKTMQMYQNQNKYITLS